MAHHLRPALNGPCVYHIPYLGYLLAVLSPPVRLALIGLPALAIAFSLLWSLWHAAGEEVRRQEAARSAIHEMSTSVEMK